MSQNNLFAVTLGGLVINDSGEFLLIHKADTGKYTFPSAELTHVDGQMWEVMEDQVAKLVFAQTGVEIADGPIPFTDQAFIGKGGFESLMQFFIGRYRFGKIKIGDPAQISEIVWKKLADFDTDTFLPVEMLVFEKADKFLKSLKGNI